MNVGEQGRRCVMVLRILDGGIMATSEEDETHTI